MFYPQQSLVFLCFERILTRIRTDLTKLSSIGETIVQKILAAHMGQVYKCLKEQNKYETLFVELYL